MQKWQIKDYSIPLYKGFMEVLILTIVLLGLAFAGIAVKILLKKNGKFAGTCASNNPYLNKEGEACSLCGAMPDEKCKGEND